MGIRAGKSILFILPALYSTGVIVIVILLILLRGDIKTRYKKVGIKYIKWDSRKPYKWALVVLVTPESAVNKSFRNFINR
jgi:superfamily II DNA helicase RecQ